MKRNVLNIMHMHLLMVKSYFEKQEENKSRMHHFQPQTSKTVLKMLTGR